jgi:Na+-driven multidrug efflux pump
MSGGISSVSQSHIFTNAVYTVTLAVIVFCAHAVIEHVTYSQCHAHFLKVALFGNSRLCTCLHRATQYFETFLWGALFSIWNKVLFGLAIRKTGEKNV